MEVTKIPKKKIILLEPEKVVLVDKEKYRQKKVAAYCRVSTDNEEQLTSYENQKKFYTEMIAKRTDWELAGIYADEGISGTQAKKREQFQKMIKDCMSGKIDYVITKSISRFARNIVDCMEYVRLLRAKGIGIYFEEQNIDTLKDESEMQLIVFAGFAQSESESISKNITWSYRKRFENGNPVIAFHRTLGYRKGKDGLPEIVPEEAEVVKRIYAMYIAGVPVSEISKTLQEEKIVFPGKKLTFSIPMIKSVVQNEKYCGDCLMQKSYTVDCISKVRKKNEGEVPMYLVQNNHPAIVSRETFNRAQAERTRRKVRTPHSAKGTRSVQGRYSKYALTDVLICAECGSRYKRVTWTSRGQKRVVWRCISRLDYGKKYCHNSPTLPEEALHQAVARAIQTFDNQDGLTFKMLMKATLGQAIGIVNGEDNINLLQRQVEALNKEMVELINSSIQNGKGMSDNEEEFKAISDQITELNEQIDRLKEVSNEGESQQERLALLQKLIEEREGTITKYDDSIVRQMIECIKVHSDGKLVVIFGGGYSVEEHI